MRGFSLAVEMLYLATVPDAYDVAVIITGDKDFMPAMVKTRMTGKRVSLCSIRNSCNRDLIKPEQAVRDYDVIWLDEYLDELVVPKLSQKGEALDARLNAIIFKFIKESSGIGSGSGNVAVSSRDLGRLLQSTGTTYPIKASYQFQHTLSIHPINTPINTHPTITPYQPLYQHSYHYTPYQPILSTHPINTPHQHTISTLSTHLSTHYYDSSVQCIHR